MAVQRSYVLRYVYVPLPIAASQHRSIAAWGFAAWGFAAWQHELRSMAYMEPFFINTHTFPHAASHACPLTDHGLE